MRRRMAAALVTLLCLVALSGCQTEVGEGLTVTVLDVGKADCIVVQEMAGGTLIVDTGTEESADTMLSFLDRQGIEKVDLLILTHMDKDHIGGAAALLEAMPVERVLQANYDKDSDESAAYYAALAQAERTPERLSQTTELSLGKAEIRVIPGRQDTYEQSNDYSLMTELQYGTRRFLFAGDAERERLQEYLDETPQQFDFLKVPHHGGKEKNSALFFAAVSPAYAVITCSQEEPADEEVLALLKQTGARVYQTVDGTVTARCDGRGLAVQQTQEDNT